jgi:hypothetical protein
MKVRITPTGCRSINRRAFSKQLAALGGAAWVMAWVGPAAADPDGDTKTEMPREKWVQVTETRSSVQGEPPTEGPTPVRNFVEENERGETTRNVTKDVEEAHGTRMLRGGEWKAKTPEQRDAYLRDLKLRFPPPATRIILTVPKGELWVIPEEDYQRLKANRTINPWTKAQIARINGQTVTEEDEESHSDIRGAGPRGPILDRIIP